RPGSRRSSRGAATRSASRRSNGARDDPRPACVPTADRRRGVAARGPMKPGWNNWDRRLPGAALLGTDPEIAALIAEETRRQSEGLELIASENFVSPAVLEAM